MADQGVVPGQHKPAAGHVTAGGRGVFCSDNGEPEEVVVSTGCSGALPALLHTQGEKPESRAELVALASV